MKLRKFKEIVDDFSSNLTATLGNEIKSLYLFGSMIIQEDFHFGISDINTFIIFKNESSNKTISKVSQIYKRYNKYPFSVPLMLKEREVLDAKDVFPVEFIEIKEKNMLLYGDDFLKDIELNLSDIRRQCETEIRAKIIGLRKMLFSQDALIKNQDVLYKSLTSTIVLLKQILRIKGQSIPETRLDVLNALEGYFNQSFDGIKNLYTMRRDEVKITKNILEALILKYIEDLEFFSKVFNEEV